MKNYLFTILLLGFLTTTNAQEFVYIDNNISDAKITIKIDDEISFPDIQVVLGKNIPFEDFTVGITPYKSQANYIIVQDISNAERSVKVDNCDNFPDLSILVKSEISFPDVRIEFRDKNAFVDILIYSEKATISEQELIACLLPLIREKAQK
jgi:hypothetical protein